MATFISLNFQDFGLSDGITETIKSVTPFCVCCLDKTAGFIKLSDCNHAGYLQDLITPKKEIPSHFVCNYCHSMLVKIEAFRKQVVECNRILNSQTNPTRANYRPPLRTTEPNHIYIDDDYKKDLLSISEPIVTIHEEPEPSRLLAELNERKKGPHAGKDPPPRRKIVKEPMYKKFAGKIRLVTLSEAEMQAERAREATSEAYVKLPYKCQDCVVAFDHEQNYTDHVAKRHKKCCHLHQRTHGDKLQYPGGVTCSICKSVLAAGSSYRKHTKNHYNRFECEDCDKRYITLPSIIQHYNMTHGPVGVTYSCQHCDFKTDVVSAYSYHRNKHRSDLQCKECGKLCSSHANMKTHLFAVHHKSDRKYICSVCKKAYNTKSGLDHHVATLHNTGAPSDAYCIECNIQFNSVRCYRAHLRHSSKHITEDAKRHACTECGAKFVTKAMMKRHLEWVHLKLFRHDCAKCGKAFRTQTLLKRHQSIVHDRKQPAKNKMCHYCGKGFTTQQVLRTHIRTHTGERPLSCTQCGATFAHHGALYTHCRRLHNSSVHGVPNNSNIGTSDT